MNEYLRSQLTINLLLALNVKRGVVIVPILDSCTHMMIQLLHMQATSGYKGALGLLARAPTAS